MVAVQGRPLLEWQIRFLKRQGFTDIILLTGHLGDQIESAFGSGTKYDLSIRYVAEHSPLGTGGAVINAINVLDDAFILCYADSFINLNKPMLLQLLQQGNSLGVMALYEDMTGTTGVPANIRLSCITNDVLEYGKAGGSEFSYLDAGVIALKKEALCHCPRNVPFSLESTLFPKLIAERKLRGYVSKERFYDIGTTVGLKTLDESVDLSHIVT